MKDYLGFGQRSPSTPQTEPLPGMVLNNTGIAYSFSVDDMTRFKRFLLLGSSDGTYYVSSRKLTKENLDALERILRAGKGLEAVQMILEVSRRGKAPTNDPALFALARCAACDVHDPIEIAEAEKTYTFHDPENRFRIPDGASRIQKNRTYVRKGDTVVLTTKTQKGTRLHPADIEVRQAALSALPLVARTGTHLFHFLAYVEQFRGWGATLKREVANWYHEKSGDRVEYQMIKYQQRDGWSHRDVLRLSHPKDAKPQKQALYNWCTKGWNQEQHERLPLVRAMELAKTATPALVAEYIHTFHLPHEAIPSEMKKERLIWETLFEDMPMEAMLRNIPTMTRIGLIESGEPPTRLLVDRLHDTERLKKARIHPMKLLLALKTYESGRNIRGEHHWLAVPSVIQALHDAFYLSFNYLEPIEKHVLIALDVSGSMQSGAVGGITGLSPQVAGSALAMVLARCCQDRSMPHGVQPNYEFLGFDTRTYRFLFTAQQRLDDILKGVSVYGGGGTDCGLPLKFALEHRKMFDAFVVITDNETWQGNIHVAQVLEKYRREINPKARYINIQMTATHVTNTRPDDLLSMEVVGFDPSVPELISQFLKEEL